MTSSMGLISQFVVLAVVALALQGSEAKPPNRIVGGTYAEIGEFKYQASLRKNGKHICGGSIIGKRHIMTAAHCIDGVTTNPSEEMTVVTGTNFLEAGKGNTNNIKSVTIHPKYSNKAEDSWENDIAIIALDKEIIFDEATIIAKMPSKNTEPKLKCVASGWGDMFYPWEVQPDNLRKVVTTTMSNKECSELHPNMKIHESQVCSFASKGAGLCSGDSGGPLAYDGEIHGISSWVTPCGRGKPDVFTRVYYFLDFIKETMAST